MTGRVTALDSLDIILPISDVFAGSFEWFGIKPIRQDLKKVYDHNRNYISVEFF